MTDIVEWLRDFDYDLDYEERVRILEEAATEIERLRVDKAAISNTASEYLHILEFVSTDPCFRMLGSVTQDAVRALRMDNENS